MRTSQGGPLATDRTTVVEQALAYSGDGHRVVAGSNGSLFSLLNFDDTVRGIGLGLNVSDGELINAGYPAARTEPHPAFGISASGAAVMGSPETDISLTLPGGATATIDRINEVRGYGMTVLYTPRLGTHTWTSDLGTEYVIDGFDLPLHAFGTYSGNVTAVNANAMDTTFGPDQVVL